jgi:Ribonuclease H2 non-catalytic subunit (Ylr154p-like)
MAKEAQSTQATHMDDGNDMAEDGEEPESVKILKEEAKFDEIMVWGHDRLPAADDTFVKGIEEWIAFAEAVWVDPRSSCSELTHHLADSRDDSRTLATFRQGFSLTASAVVLNSSFALISIVRIGSRLRSHGRTIPLHSLLLCQPFVLESLVGLISCTSLPESLEDPTSFLLFRPLTTGILLRPILEHLSILPIFPSTFMIGISTCSRHTHLDELASHVCTDEITPFAIRHEDVP